MYSVKTEANKQDKKKAKGLKKSLVKKELTYQIYVNCVKKGEEDRSRTAFFLRSDRHHMYLIKQTKKSLNPLDTKRQILPNRIIPRAFSHYLTTEEKNTQNTRNFIQIANIYFYYL